MPFTPGFQLAEALDLLAMCANVEDEATPPIPPAPPGWTLVFDSPVIGTFDEKWQLWRSAAGPWAIALRGTVMRAGSIFEDLISILVGASGVITVGPHPIPYRFATDAAAGIHLGFALGTLLLLKDREHGILAQLAARGIAPGDVYITGHSQGAAMATLLRSYLAYAPDAPAGCAYKTYVFAQPKPGNGHYALDFDARFANAGFAFRVTNSLDWVPQVPFTLEFLQDVDRPNPLSVLASPSLLMSLLTKLPRAGRRRRALAGGDARPRAPPGEGGGAGAEGRAGPRAHRRAPVVGIRRAGAPLARLRERRDGGGADRRATVRRRGPRRVLRAPHDDVLPAAASTADLIAPAFRPGRRSRGSSGP